ncbi:PAS domain-containing protein [Caballeronia sp. LZ062]|uniref:PAS domain-containing protein n=1 Tax=unclassified Caballeronia TaxID=2646786 RepID=UPI002864F9CD|nr:MULTISPECIES: PAS domain-containing protein [unclassified Caballeronia]MDR5856038.1 PAS domain-containing protein [Caballeronia sp. LZ050]MDR5872709.1 PAS domain-containing protein [Caballeronia sp. LZ062]
MHAHDHALTLALLDANPAFCAVLGTDLTIVQANTRFMQQFGWPPADLDAEPFLSVIRARLPEPSREDACARLMSAARQALAGGRVASAIEHVADESMPGGIQPWRFDFRPLGDATGNAAYGAPAVLLVAQPDAESALLPAQGSVPGSRERSARPVEGPPLSDSDEQLTDYRLLAEVMPLIVWTARPDGTVDYLSSVAFQHTAPDQHLLGRAWEALLHPNDRENTLARWAASVASGTDYTIDHRFRQTDGTYRWMRSLASPMRRTDGAIVRWVGATIDVGNPGNVELDRMRLESRYRALVTVASAVAYVCDAMGRFVAPQPSWESYTGQPWEEHRDYGWVEMIHPDDRATAQAALAKSLATNTPYRADVRVWHAASSTHRRCQVRAAGTHDEQGAVFEWVGMITDVEETLRSAQSLREERHRLHLSIEAADIGTFHCPIPFDRIIWNTKCKEHFWLPANAGVGMELFYARVHPDDRNKTRVAVEQSVQHGIPYDVEYRTVSPSGEIRWIRAKGRTHVDEQGKPLRFDGITIDITRQKTLELERDRLLTNERLLRLEAQHTSQLKDTFLATVSHELRTPLNAMQSWLFLLKQENANPGLTARGIDAIERNVQLQARLVDDLLDLSRIAAGKLLISAEPFDLVPLLMSEISDIELAAGAKRVTVTADLPDALVVEGDEVRLRQVFSNLLSNALKYTGQEGRIRVCASTANNWVEVQVADNGAGIAASFIDRVFEPFAQASQATTRTFGGLGIGLAIARSIVTLHGGSITAQSDGEGRGSTFTVQLPRASAARSRQSASEPVNVAPDCGGALAGLSILLVEDEADAREAMSAVLQSAGAAVCDADSAAAARRCIAAQAFDVVLSDIGMPGEDGYLLMRSLREAGWTMPAIAVTAFGTPEDKARARQAGFDMHCPKPVDPGALFRAITQLVARHRGKAL